MSSLRNVITQLASQFAAGVLDAIRGASLEEILAETNGGAGRGGAGRRGRAAVAAAPAAEAGPVKAGRGRRRGGRLGRRSADDIAEIVERIVTLLGQSAKGLRAEQIREKLGLEAKELPRPIAEALASKRISKQGQKRATTYFAGAGRGGGAKAGGGRRAGRPAKKAGRGAKRAAKAKAKRPAAAKKTTAAAPATTNGAATAAEATA